MPKGGARRPRPRPTGHVQHAEEQAGCRTARLSSMEEAHKASATRAGVQPLRTLSLERWPACCRRVPLSAHLSVAEAAGPPESYAQMGSRNGTALCTSLRGPHKYDAIPETQPPQFRTYNDSLTQSNACATMALTGRAFLSSQLTAGEPIRRTSLTQSIHCSSTGCPFCTGAQAS